MIIFVFGTHAELYKLTPVLNKLKADEYELWFSGQQEFTSLVFSKGDISAFPLLGKGHPPISHGPVSLIRWGLSLPFALGRQLRKLSALTSQRLFLVVHGDTLTALLASLVGHFLGIPIFHIEAGLRSGKILAPFPEEITRRIVTRLASVHFVPGEHYLKALNQESGTKVNTYFNTALDQVVETSKREFRGKLPEVFFLVSLHRFELVRRRKLLSDVLKSINEAGSTIPAVVVADPLFSRALTQFRLWNLLSAPNVVVLPRLEIADFHHLISRCEFMVTDSGGQQEESTFFGTPCLLLRDATERLDGLGRNVVLGGLEAGAISLFLEDYTSYRYPKRTQVSPSPSKIIVDYMRQVSLHR